MSRTFTNDRGEQTPYPTMLQELGMCGPAGVVALVIVALVALIALACGTLGLMGQVVAGVVIGVAIVSLLSAAIAP
jgi:hypothetical protein